MGKVAGFAVLLLAASCAAATQKAPKAPNHETRHPSAVRSPYSRGDDLAVPLCPARFHDSLSANGIAAPHQQGVTPPKPTKEIPAQITQDAVRSAGKTHIGNFLVLLDAVIDAHGHPTRLCLEKSSGYGLDASAAAARQYRFKPAQKDGKPVAMRIAVEVPFTAPNPPEAPGPLPPKP
jgi:hypothetical protein